MDDSDNDAEIIPQHQPEFLSLTQVCRGIRAEYLPLYRAQASVSV